MNHPYELLAEYVDGALPVGERAVVSAHLDGCAECRAEVALARSARRALASLADEPVPAGLGAAAVAAASREAGATAATPWWYRGAGFAAAAAVVGLLAIALPRLVSDEPAPPSSALEAGAAPDAAAPGAARQVELLDTDFTPETLADLAIAAGSPPTVISAEAATLEDATAVRQCLLSAFPELEGTAVLLIRARFQGADAYIGVFEAGPGAGEPPDTRTAFAASVDGCRPLSFESYPI